MPFIGIIAKESDSNFIKNEITKNKKLNNFEVININRKSLENIKNVRFDILVINENNDNLLENSKYLENIISRTNYIIINSDEKNNLSILSNKGTNIITYGFNSKATITISSIKEESTMICIQRAIKGVNNIIEEQEINIKIERNNANKLYNILVIFTILLIYGEILQKK